MFSSNEPGPVVRRKLCSSLCQEPRRLGVCPAFVRSSAGRSMLCTGTDLQRALAKEEGGKDELLIP
jgi:hypothetical protein